MQNEAKMESNRHLIINVILGRFGETYGNIAGAAGVTLLQPTPQGGAILSNNIVQ